MAHAPSLRAFASTTVTHDATVFAFGGASFAGSPGVAQPAPLIGLAPRPDGTGYWVASADGGIYNYGTAPFLGSPRTSHLRLNAPIVAIVSDPVAPGYWLVSSRGQVFPYGAAKWYGALYPAPLTAPIVAIAATPTGKGYWFAAADGGVFTFGDAAFHGSAFGLLAGSAIVAMTPTFSGSGYWLTASNGGVFTFGAASFYGSAYGRTNGAPVVSTARSLHGLGYYVLDAKGGLYTFGDASFGGSASGSVTFLRRAVTVSTALTRGGYWILADNQTASGVVIAPGQSGAGPSALQGALLTRGFWLQLDGVYDDLTMQAVYAFQKVLGRPRTGVVTMGDWLALQAMSRPVPRSTSGSTAEIDLARQVLIIANNGVTVWIYNTSTGSGAPYSYNGVNYLAITPVGHFSILRQIDGLDISHLGTLWRPKFFTTDGVAVHGSPSIPPYPASHGCVRLTNAAIDWIWAKNLLPIGAAVWVY